jgi:hypothetical protein
MRYPSSGILPLIASGSSVMSVYSWNILITFI